MTMRRLALAIGAIAVGIGVLALSGDLAGTASNSVPTSTAGYTSVSATGATVKSINYTISANTISGFTVAFKGSVLLKTVTARFDTGPTVVCLLGLYDAAADQTPATCTGLAQTANQSWRLSLTVA
jgi:hypothetical protein